jgi:hypothetical protein
VKIVVRNKIRNESMYRRAVVLSLVSFALVASVLAGVSNSSSAQESSDDRVSALETQVAELEATVAALAGSEEAASEPTEAGGALTSVVTEATSVRATSDGTSTGYLSGTAFDLLPPGNSGELAVVSNGVYDGMSLPLLVRNNTGEALIRVSVAVSVRDASGALLAVGEASDLTPARVESGSYAFGSAYFDFATFPSDATYEFQAVGESPESAFFIGQFDMVIQESSYLGDRIVGTAINEQIEAIQGPIGVDAACFGADGSLLGVAADYAAAETAAPGEAIPFQVTLYNVASCDLYLIGASGYTF